MRGREELSVAISNEVKVGGSPLSSHEDSAYPCLDRHTDCFSSFVAEPEAPAAEPVRHRLEWSLYRQDSSHCLRHSLMLSARTQRNLSGYGYIDIGLPPASPSEHEAYEAQEADYGSTMFLIAAYSKYCCPYVWVSSDHLSLAGLCLSSFSGPIPSRETCQDNSYRCLQPR